ncbi:MAG: phospholipase D-like domain-containing protein [Akkermansia sp.]
MHQKVVLMDDDIATVGTANLDNRSLALNFEITAVIHSPPPARR